MNRVAILAIAVFLGQGCASQDDVTAEGTTEPSEATPSGTSSVAASIEATSAPIAAPMPAAAPAATPSIGSMAAAPASAGPDATPDPAPAEPAPMQPAPVAPEPAQPEPMMAPMPMESGPEPVASGDGAQPTIPSVDGPCPDFRDGASISVGGHGGVLILAGRPGMNGPLLFYWHGTGSSSSEATFMLPASVRREITSQGGIVASFNGRQQARGGRDCSGTGAHNMNDFGAADQIAACAVENHGIDPRRIYSTGCSAGGLQTGCMAQNRSEYIAAVAPNSGGLTFPGRYSSSYIPHAFTMHGGSGDNVIVNFGDTSRTYGGTVKNGGGTWIECNHMRGHCLAPGNLYEAAWEFLKAHPYGTKSSPYEGGSLPGSFPNYCMLH
ncbi:MAG: prolyl oligopeptidase family serine peptidase [Myxococcales bacterium]|nr:prolyl oligopeptidase family serine peptidase [Myxococcales bacterium]